MWQLPQLMSRAKRKYPGLEVRGGGCALLVLPWRQTHVQGNRNPGKTVGTERGDQEADRLKLQSQTVSQSDHMDHRLV